MYKLKFNDPIHIHFIGIGGISMSGLAEILLEKGFTISGSDAKESDLTRMLASKGAQIFMDKVLKISFPALIWLSTQPQSIRIIRNLQRPDPRDCQCSPVQNCLDRSWTTTTIPLPLPEPTAKQPQLP